MIVQRYALEIVMDDAAWKANYGEADLWAVEKDIRESMASIVADLVDEWISKSGNVGAVRKIVAK